MHELLFRGQSASQADANSVLTSKMKVSFFSAESRSRLWNVDVLLQGQTGFLMHTSYCLPLSSV